MPPPWATWTVPNATSRFSDARAAANADYLRLLLGGSWIDEGVVGTPSHPLLSLWRWGGPEAFMQLNAVAEDLRLLDGLPGIEPALHDLRQPQGYEPTRHVLRMAAMIARGGTRVTQLFAPSNDSVPDFEIEADGTAIAVEAKQLTESEPERQFNTYAQALRIRILNEVCLGPENYPVLHIVFKSPHALPDAESVIYELRAALALYSGIPAARRSPGFNIYVDPDPASANLVGYRSIHILCPRSSKENLRIARRAEKSNRQLRHYNRDRRPGLLCLGLTEYQDPHVVADVLRGKFKGSQLRGISGVLLHAAASGEGPGRWEIVEMLGQVDNPNALVPIHARFPLRPAGGAVDLFEARPRSDDLPAYRAGGVQGRQKGMTPAMVGFTMTRSLTREMLD